MLAALVMVGHVEDTVVLSSLSPSGLPNQPVNMKVSRPTMMTVSP